VLLSGCVPTKILLLASSQKIAPRNNLGLAALLLCCVWTSHTSFKNSSFSIDRQLIRTTLIPYKIKKQNARKRAVHRKKKRTRANWMRFDLTTFFPRYWLSWSHPQCIQILLLYSSPKKRQIRISTSRRVVRLERTQYVQHENTVNSTDRRIIARNRQRCVLRNSLSFIVQWWCSSR